MTFDLPRIRTILILVSIIVLCIPLGSIYLLRIYENELVQQTESELIGQAAGLGATYRQYLAIEGEPGPMKKKASDPWGRKSAEKWVHYVQPRLNLAKDPILAPFPEPVPDEISPDAAVLEAGKHLNAVISDVQQVTLASIRILDRNGIIIATSGNDMGFSLAHTKEVQHALQGNYVSTFRKKESADSLPPLASISRGKNIRVFVALPVFDKDTQIGVILLSRTPVDLLKALYRQWDLVLFGLFLAVFMAVSMALIISLTISRPIHRLVRQVTDIARNPGSRPQSLKHPMTREIDHLSKSFVAMAETLEQRAEYIRNFALHVSHEFKTPLTAIQGSVELLLTHMDSMPKEKRIRFLVNITQDTHRLKKLVERLLEFARADVFSPAEETSDAAEISKTLANHYRDFGLVVTLDSTAETTTVTMSEEILTLLISNMLDNSLSHRADRVWISLQNTGSMLEIQIRDNGEGISEKNQDRIFTPFFTTRREKGGTGLGLSIIQSLLRAHKGTIHYRGNEQGAVFVLRIPSEAA